ncbi:MAG: DUF4124 domain-containing protein [Gammaproteobacteria bacterium]|nr:DUF4124 domain-containing protein [Gammaproteobacteria bacterium]
MKSVWILLLVVVVALPAMAGTIYRWVDSNGVVHYSDQAHPGAKKVDLNALQVVHFRTPTSDAASQEEPAKEKPVPSYTVKILAPADGTTLRPANNEVHASVKVVPVLSPPALLRYSLDGQDLGQPTAALRALIKQVYRGTHTLTVTVLGAKGESIGSASSTFYVHQHSILNNPNPGPGPSTGPGG